MVQPTTPNAPNALKEYTVKASVRDLVTKKLLVITSKYEVHTSAQANQNPSLILSLLQ